MTKPLAIAALLALLPFYSEANPIPLPGKAINFSARADVTIKPLIHGMVTDSDKLILIRAVGPTLFNYGVDEVISRPTLRLHNKDGQLIGRGLRMKDLEPQQYDRIERAEKACGAFPLARDSDDVVLLYVANGIFTCIADSELNETGEVLLEAYLVPFEEADRASQLIDYQ